MSDVEEHGLVLALQSDVEAVHRLAAALLALRDEGLAAHLPFDEVDEITFATWEGRPWPPVWHAGRTWKRRCLFDVRKIVAGVSDTR